jgi:hypothetical protein
MQMHNIAAKSFSMQKMHDIASKSIHIMYLYYEYSHINSRTFTTADVNFKEAVAIGCATSRRVRS